MEAAKNIAISLFGLYVFAVIIVTMSGEFSHRSMNNRTVLKVMAAIAIAIPVIGFIVN